MTAITPRRHPAATFGSHRTRSDIAVPGVKGNCKGARVAAKRGRIFVCHP